MENELFQYIVICDSGIENDPYIAFEFWAEDSEHAEEQMENFDSTIPLLWVYTEYDSIESGGNPELVNYAFNDFYNIGEQNEGV